MRRPLTPGEKALLMNVFGAFTLPYSEIKVDTNDHNLGGAINSITPLDVAYLSTLIYVADFSDPGVPADKSGVFVHEMTHVWQFHHDYHKLLQFGWLYVSKFFDYEKAYPYDLASSSDFDYYNMEQQAAIVEDWWLITHNSRPSNNTGARTSAADYAPFLAQIQNSGPPAPQLKEAELTNALGSVLANSY
jgi:type VI secretion system secreted protein VgrG